MNSFKKRLLMSLSAAALAVPMAATSVQAIEVVILDQVNTATQTAELSFGPDAEFDDVLGGIWGESLAATAAAIGNSAAFNVEGATDAAALDLSQINQGHAGEFGNQFADIHLHEVDLGAGVAEGIQLTAAAIGNTLSGTGEGNIVDIDLSQVNGEGEGEGFGVQGQYAHVEIIDAAISGLESSISAAALGNSASLTAGTIGTGDGFDLVDQVNNGAQYAHIDIDDLLVQPAETGAVLDATAAAIGNSLTLTAESGDLYLDTLSQVNEGAWDDDIGSFADNFGQAAHVDFASINDVTTPVAPVGVSAPVYETFDSEIVAAAIGNSATLSAEGTVLLDELTQDNLTWQNADIDVDWAYGLGDLTGTAVAIGNSLSITAGGDLAFDKIEGGIAQLNDVRSGWYDGQDAEIDLEDLNVNGDLALTVAAIGNSLSVEAGGSFDFGAETTLSQINWEIQDSEIELDEMAGLEDVSATAVAIGNSLTLAAGGDFSFGSYGRIEQLNHDYQDVEIDLDDINAAGDVELTLAAIGNSLSLTAEGELSGVGASIGQVNNYEQEVDLDIDDTIGSFASLNATGVAIGNSLSLTAGSFGGTGSLGISQMNAAYQQVSFDLDDAGLGAISATTAAIGNSASVTIK